LRVEFRLLYDEVKLMVKGGAKVQLFRRKLIEFQYILSRQGIMLSMKKLLIVLVSLFLLVGATRALAVEEVIESGKTATVSAQIEEATKEDITERTSPVKGRLEGYLAERKLKPVRPSNFIQHAIRQAVAQGVSANTIVLVLLFPLVAGLIVASRHLLGLTGFGIFVPAILAVVFVATGIRVGMIMFVLIWLMATVSRSLTKRLKLQYLPRMALLMWMVSIGVLAVMLSGVSLGLGELSAVSIFPILILMLLAENFIEVQVGKSKREAFRVTMQTILMAVGAAVVLKLDQVQKLVLLNPELSLVLVAMFDIYVGKYVGLRALEFFKFKKLVKK